MSGTDIKGTAGAEAGSGAADRGAAGAEAGSEAADRKAVDRGRLGVEEEAAEARFLGVAWGTGFERWEATLIPSVWMEKSNLGRC